MFHLVRKSESLVVRGQQDYELVLLLSIDTSSYQALRRTCHFVAICLLVYHGFTFIKRAATCFGSIFVIVLLASEEE